MIAELAAAFATARQVADATKAVLNVSQDITINAKISELFQQIIGLQAAILGAQTQYDEQAEVIRNLESKLMERDKWDAEAKSYQFKTLGTGVHVYALRPEAQGAELPHWLCPDCYNTAKKSILQPDAGASHHICHRCTLKILTGGERADSRPPSTPKAGVDIDVSGEF